MTPEEFLRTQLWVSESEVKDYLGKGWSKESLYERRRSGELVEGVHWRDERPINSQRANIKYDIFAINLLLSKPLSSRA